MFIPLQKKVEKAEPESVALLPAALWQESFKLGFIPPSSSFLLLHVTALPNLQPLPRALQHSWELGGEAACLQGSPLACVHSLPCFSPSHVAGGECLHSAFAFAHGDIFSKIRRELNVSGEGKLTLYLIFKVQQLT